MATRGYTASQVRPVEAGTHPHPGTGIYVSEG